MAPPTLSVGDIAATSDAEPGQFIKTHRGHRHPDGRDKLAVDSRDKLSEDERDHLAERLKAQEQGLAQSPLDPNDLASVAARLCQVSLNKSFSMQPETETETQARTTHRSRSPLPPPSDLMRRETEAYHELIHDGGRPLYPIDLIQDVHQDHDKYADMLRPWQLNILPVSPPGIFQKQLRRWQDFRKWQNDNRGREDDDDGFPAYVQRQRLMIQRDRRPKAAAKLLGEIAADPSRVRREWEDEQRHRERQRRFYSERGCRGFRDYADVAQRRLVRHGFTQPFELDQDPTKQDKLTTWIEYLNYEYWWLDKHTDDMEGLEPANDKLWQELVDKKMLRRHETREFVPTMASSMERDNEMEQAQGAFQLAMSEGQRIYAMYAPTQKDPKCPSIPNATRIPMLTQAAEKLDAARQQLKQIRSRNDQITQFVQATFGYTDAKRDADRQRVLVQWVLDQVPLMAAAETNQREANRGIGFGGRRATKRRLTADEEPLERQSLKKLRLDLGELRLASVRAPSKASKATRRQQPETRTTMDQEAAHQSPQPGCSRRDTGEAMPQGPRDSTQIATRDASSSVGIEPGTAQAETRSGSGATPAQPPRRPLPAEDAKAHTAGRRRRRDKGHGDEAARHWRAQTRAGMSWLRAQMLEHLDFNEI